jgi:hypothetical protein
MAFCRLKGRWSVCTRNKSYYDPQLCKAIVEACCGLHTFLESTLRQMPDGFVEDQDVDFLLPPTGAGVKTSSWHCKEKPIVAVHDCELSNVI